SENLALPYVPCLMTSAFNVRRSAFSVWLGPDIDEFSWVKQFVRIHCLLHQPQQRIRRVAHLAAEEGLFGEADAVFAGDGSASLEGLVDDGGQREFDAVHLLGVTLVGEDGRVKVAVAEVAEGGDGETMLLRDRLHGAHHAGEFAARYGDVLEDRRRAQPGEGRERAAARGRQLDRLSG